MIELSKINPGTAKVTVARPMGRAASNGGAREVEAVTPVVLDNDAALGFLRERARQQASGQQEKQLGQKDQPETRRSGHDARQRMGIYDSERAQTSYSYQRPHREPSLHTSASTGFVTHLIGQTESELVSAPAGAQKRMLLERFNQSSEAYRRAGAEPVYYGEASQFVRVAV